MKVGPAPIVVLIVGGFFWLLTFGADTMSQIALAIEGVLVVTTIVGAMVAHRLFSQ